MKHSNYFKKLTSLGKASLCTLLVYFCFVVCVYSQYKSTPHLPYLYKSELGTQLIVEGKPFIIRGGELGNSTFTSVENMQPVWQKLKDMNINTVLAPVYWELIEKEEGKFDFKLLDDLVVEARKYDLKLVLLWFGSYKNSMSSHVPAWVKLDQDRFPRVKDEFNKSHEILTPFSRNNLEADKRAFVKLMQHIKKIDGKEKTIIMIQCENEMGMLPSARDHHPLANEVFDSEVPKDLIQYLQANKENIHPHITKLWAGNGYKTTGNWKEVFGGNQYANELFMAYYYSRFASELILAGKDVHPLPMFVNAALNRPKRLPGKGYPSAGPIPHVLDIWKSTADGIDFYAPDFYFPNIEYWCDKFVTEDNPLFIPEHKFDNTVAAKALFTIGHYQSMGFSPFSIESGSDEVNTALSQSYDVIRQVSHILTDHKNTVKIDAVLLDKEDQEKSITFGDYVFTIKHSYTLGWEAGAKDDTWDHGSALIMQVADNEFYITGSGFVITFSKVDDPDTIVGILKNEDGYFKNNKWVVKRHLNGDQTHQGRHVRMPAGNYNIQRLELYDYK